jgi:hypothetical protein
MTKTEALRRHTKRRALQRHGLTLNRHDLRELASLARTGIHLDRRSNRVSKKRIEFRGRTLDVVYDHDRKTIVTVLP